MTWTDPRKLAEVTRWSLGLALALALALTWRGFGAGPIGTASPDSAPAVPRYGRDIRPILSDRCFQCHGPDLGTRKAELRLDLRDEAIKPRKDGRPAIVPGHAADSELWSRIHSTDPDVVMPPKSSHKKALSEEEKRLIGAWIDAGAVYEPHWSFVAPKRPLPPTVSDDGWIKNDIDRFVLARLDAERITPSPVADSPTLARRVFLDLTGLPPTPEELDAFLADVRPDAYERLVDTLFTAEPYRTRVAERLAAPWMDQARYADTSGIHMDAGRQSWLWRDWVINAYRDNMPFDRFVVEQLGGDLMPGATDAQKIASGFHRNHVTSDEGGAIAEEYLVEYAVDRTATTGSVFLGLTVGCARCHDHKYDPVSQEEFYRLYAFFNSIEEPGLYSQVPDAKRALEPFLAVPTREQKAMLESLRVESERLTETMKSRDPAEEKERAAFVQDIAHRAGIAWAPTSVTSATSSKGTTFDISADGIVHASNASPATDSYAVTLSTDAKDLRLIALEVLPDETRNNLIGRGMNGNVVVTGISIEAVSVKDPSTRITPTLSWCWADFSQINGDYDITNLLLHRTGNDSAANWALGGHQHPGGRVALFLFDQPVGFDGGTSITVTLDQNSIYSEHTLAKIRLRAGSITDDGVALLPTAPSRWYIAGPFQPKSGESLYDSAFGPESSTRIDFQQAFPGEQRWRYDEKLVDGTAFNFGDGAEATYFTRTIFSPTDRDMPVSLGTDDGFQLFQEGKEIAARRVDRSLRPDQDAAVLHLLAGANTVVCKVVNSGGPAGFFWRGTETAELAGDVMAAALPTEMLSQPLRDRFELGWRMSRSPRYREAAAALKATETKVAAIESTVPLTMVMKEMPTERETFVLSRGAYDQPDKKRKVTRAIPAALGALPADAPVNRLGLGEWLMSAENPLTARVTVNRFWELFFGVGIVKTTEDFGQQGDWPSHPELLDWLAVEFRESGWDMRHMLRLMVTSSTYKQASTIRTELRERDPENRLLASFPRRRLTAEQIRDQSLYVSGLLVEKVGGPSVKPYQPEGLWQEVAMPQSNTRVYEQGMGEDLWRRSLYTYWKRASPPPSLLTFDAPTREFCTIRRNATSTPLQALVLWNDEQYVEAARVLAQRTLSEEGDDTSRLRTMFRRCTSRTPEADELSTLNAGLARFRERFQAAPDDAESMLKRGQSPRAAGIAAPELAAWTMLASTMINLYESSTQH